MRVHDDQKFYLLVGRSHLYCQCVCRLAAKTKRQILRKAFLSNPPRPPYFNVDWQYICNAQWTPHSCSNIDLGGMRGVCASHTLLHATHRTCETTGNIYDLHCLSFSRSWSASHGQGAASCVLVSNRLLICASSLDTTRALIGYGADRRACH